MRTLAELTYTLPLTMEIVTSAPLTVAKVVFVKTLLYPTVPCTTWYVKIDEMASVERFPLVKTEPMAWNASLEGAKMVTSARASTVSAKFVAVRAPASEVTFKEPAVSNAD